MHTIAMCVDQNYFLPSMVTLASIADASPPADRAASSVRILTKNLTSAQSTTMATFVRRLGFRSFDVAWRQPTPGHTIVHGSYISTTTYLRFNLTPAMTPDPYVVYVDADVLVLGDVFAPLNDLGDAEIGLVRDPVHPTVGEGPALPGVTARWPDLAGQAYFNAGMFWARTATLPRLRRQIDQIMIDDNRHIYFNDQDALNLWALRNGAAVRPVEDTYNTLELSRFSEDGDWVQPIVRRARPRTSPAVLHFAGTAKPWHRSCPSTDGTRVYRRYLSDVTRQAHRLGTVTETLPFEPPAGRASRRAPRLYSGGRSVRFVPRSSL